MDDMLFLAGLVGMAGVGAAAFVGLKPDAADDDEDMPPEEDTLRSGEGTSLLNQIRDHSGEDGLLPSGAAVGFTAAPHVPSGGGWADDVLNEVMAELENAREGEQQTSGHAEPLTYNAAMLHAGDVELEDEASVDQLLGDWIAERDGAEVLDYESRTESLMVVWDDTDESAIEPQVDVAPDPDDPEVMHVSMNGEHVAEVYGDSTLSVADLTLIPLSSAMAVGLEAA